jgi:hypothetical protein
MKCPRIRPNGRPHALLWLYKENNIHWSRWYHQIQKASTIAPITARCVHRNKFFAKSLTDCKAPYCRIKWECYCFPLTTTAITSIIVLDQFTATVDTLITLHFPVWERGGEGWRSGRIVNLWTGRIGNPHSMRVREVKAHKQQRRQKGKSRISASPQQKRTKFWGKTLHPGKNKHKILLVRINDDGRHNDYSFGSIHYDCVSIKTVLLFFFWRILLYFFLCKISRLARI